ncbi:MAG: lysophospholipid acyltransferase family protein [Acidimicrobiia bacterium]|nr:lysophospholipid acyltransferase family protein [Acidimicrobiia bacterium]
MEQSRPLWLRCIDWVTTIPMVVAFGTTLVLGDICARIARLFSLRAMEIAVGAAQRVLIWTFRISGVRLTVERDPAVLAGRGYIFLSNHQSLFDVPIFGGLLFSNYPKYVAKIELAKWIPLISFNLKRGGNVIIDRGNRIDSVRAIAAFAATCQQRDVSAVIFPEGTRSRDGALKDFRKAGTAVLLDAAPTLPVVPTTIDGSWRLLINKMFPIPFGTKVRVRFGVPIERRADDAGTMLDVARSEIARTLDEWRADPLRPNPGGEGPP